MQVADWLLEMHSEDGRKPNLSYVDIMKWEFYNFSNYALVVALTLRNSSVFCLFLFVLLLRNVHLNSLINWFFFSGINGEGIWMGQLGDPGSPGKMAVKTEWLWWTDVSMDIHCFLVICETCSSKPWRELLSSVLVYILCKLPLILQWIWLINFNV